MPVAPTAAPKPLVLIILDGFGHSDSPDFTPSMPRASRSTIVCWRLSHTD